MVTKSEGKAASEHAMLVVGDLEAADEHLDSLADLLPESAEVIARMRVQLGSMRQSLEMLGGLVGLTGKLQTGPTQ